MMVIDGCGYYCGRWGWWLARERVMRRSQILMVDRLRAEVCRPAHTDSSMHFEWCVMDGCGNKFTRHGSAPMMGLRGLE